MPFNRLTNTEVSSIATNLYRSIMKGTVLFGGTQMVSIVANVLRGKMVAILLCAGGLGISSLYMNTLMPLQQFFAMGMPIAVVSAIAAMQTDDAEGRRKVNAQITAFRRSLFVLAMLGAAFMVGTAPLLSEMSFGNYDNTTAYMLLAIALVFLIMESGETAVLQSRRQMKQVAMRNVVNALASLFVGVPLYWWLGVGGIVPAIILSTMTVWTYSRLQTRRLHRGQADAEAANQASDPAEVSSRQSWRETWRLSRDIISLGFFMMIAALLGNITNYFINNTIRYFGTIDDVGLYSASTSITSQYVGLVFAAMATDYYPRLAATIGSIGEVRRLIRQQLELVLLIVAPLVAILIVTAPLLIRILLTEQFLPLTGVVRLTGLAIICKAACFPLDYVSMAYGNKRYFFWMEGVWCNLKTFVFIVVGYKFWGIMGIGWATLASGLVDVIVTTIMTRWVFGISAWRLQLRLFVPLMMGGGACAALSFCESPWLSWGGMVLCALALSGVCLWLLARRINLSEWIKNRKAQKKIKVDSINS